jgi:hypothetical protein
MSVRRGADQALATTPSQRQQARPRPERQGHERRGRDVPHPGASEISCDSKRRLSTSGRHLTSEYGDKARYVATDATAATTTSPTTRRPSAGRPEGDGDGKRDQEDRVLAGDRQAGEPAQHDRRPRHRSLVVRERRDDGHENDQPGRHLGPHVQRLAHVDEARGEHERGRGSGPSHRPRGRRATPRARSS